MTSFNEQVHSATEMMASRPLIFSSQDVADFGGWGGLEDTIDVILNGHKSILQLNALQRCVGEGNYYIGRRIVINWWRRHTLRLARANVDYLTPRQIANSMSAALDKYPWDAPPSELMAMGRRLLIVTDGCVPGTLVSPWVTMLRANPAMVQVFNAILASDSPSCFFKGMTMVDIVNDVVKELPDRDADIVSSRFGLGERNPETLDSLGRRYGVSRERIRQIEVKTLKKFS